MSKEVQRALIKCKALVLGPRMNTASFRTKKKNINMNVILCYTPTNDDNKDAFYQKLQATLDKLKNKDISFVISTRR
jgi:hypothetical protein